MRVTFIGGFKDGEVSDVPSLEAQVEFREVPRTKVVDFDFNKTISIDDVDQIKTDWYRLEHLVSYETKFFFYVEESIAPDQWVRKLVDGYHPV